MKNILITGTSTGIGSVIARYLTLQGHNVLGTSRKGSTEMDINKILKLDVTDEVSVKECITQAMEYFGKIDLLINNAGFGVAGSIEDTSIEEAKSQFDTNYFGVVRMTKGILPYMRKQRNGIIINICSTAGIIGVPFQGHYSASKFAIEGFTESLRYELVPYNIQVTNINPGDFNTEFTKNRHIVKNISTVYRSKFDQMMTMFENEEANGADPLRVAKLVQKLIGKRGKLRIGYNVGRTDQMIFLVLRKLIGDNLFEKIARSI